MPHAHCLRVSQALQATLLRHEIRPPYSAQQTAVVHLARAAFASAADAATKDGPEAKKEAKKSALEAAFSALKVAYGTTTRNSSSETA